MEVLQIFNRTTGVWSHRITLTAGYTESFVLDKSTDSAEVKWWEFTNTDIEPPYQDDDWVLLLHVENKDDDLTFNADGTTENATQYIIKAISKDYDEGNGLWKMSCALEEPIERFKRIVGETLSYTNQTSKHYDGEVASLTTPNVGMSANGKTVRLTYRGGVYQDRIMFGKTGYTAYIIIYYYGDTTRPQYTIRYGSGSGDVVDGDIAGDYVDIDLTPYNLGNITEVDNEKESIQFVETYSNPTYYKEPYNYYTALRRWLMVTPANCDTYTDNTYQKSSNNKSWYNRIKILDEAWLKTIPFADDTWNEMDLYRILFDKYDPLGKTPVAYFDLNTNTTLPNNMARDEYILKFERQDGFDKPIIDFDELIRRKPYERLLSYEVSKDNSTNITGLVCNAENLSVGAFVSYPARNFYAVPEVDSGIRNLDTAPYNQTGTDNWVIRFPMPIKKISHVSRCVINGSNVQSLTMIKRKKTNITNKVLERQQYLAYGDRGANPTTDDSLLWYEEGGKLLHIKEYGAGTENGSGIIYYVEYEPLPSARLLIGDTEKTQQINQTSSQVDAESFGRFADSYLKGSNKADITIGKLYAGDYEDFADLIGSRVKRGDKTYMITQVAYRNIGMDGYNVFMQLNENHMRKNASYRAPQEIRANTAIATSNLKNRLTAIKQVVKVGFTAAAVADNDSYQFLTDKKILLSALCPNQIDSKYYPQVALFKGKSTLYTDAGLTNATQFNIDKYLPISKILSCNQIGLNAVFYDNADAGKSKVAGLKEVAAGAGTFRNAVSQYPVLYTDPFGEVERCNLYFSAFGSEDGLKDINYNYEDGEVVDDYIARPEFNRTLQEYDRMANLPELSSADTNLLINNAGVSVADKMCEKDMLEMFNVTVWVEVVSSDTIVTSNLLKFSRLLNIKDAHGLKIVTFNSKKAENDSYTFGQKDFATVASFSVTSSSIEYTLSKALAVTAGESFAISTTDNVLLAICNDLHLATITELSQSKLTLYFK